MAPSKPNRGPLTNKSLLLVEEAVAYGDKAALFLSKLRYWTKHNRKHHGTAADGHVWVYQSQANWIAKDFPQWSLSTLRRITERLEQQRAIIIEMRPVAHGQPVLHYRLADELLYDAAPGAAPEPIAVAESVGSSGQFAQGRGSSLDSDSVQNEQVEYKDPISIQLRSKSLTVLPHEQPEPALLEERAEAAAPGSKPQWLISLGRKVKNARPATERQKAA